MTIGAATPAQAGDKNLYSFAPQGTVVSPADRKVLDANRVTHHSRKQSEALAIPSVAELRTACESHRVEAAATAFGWLRSRFEQCFNRGTTGVAVRTDNGRVAGEIRFNLWVLGVASNGTREIKYHIFAENISTSVVPGEPLDWNTQLMSFDFFNCAAIVQVSCVSDGHVPTVGSWKADSSQVYTVSSPEGVGAGDDLKVLALLPLDVSLGSPPMNTVVLRENFKSDVRFDSGRGVASKHGAVFPAVLPSFQLSLTDSAVKDSALHIFDAQNRPERTFPSWVGKSMPGKTASEPLHRMFDEAKRKDNRAASVRVCIDVWGIYSETGLDCDEYPFATTQEGAVTGTIDPKRPRSSARLIPGNDNELAGSRLGAFYSNDRVLHGDPFVVTILP